jgi:hypothetical protein
MQPKSLSKVKRVAVCSDAGNSKSLRQDNSGNDQLCKIEASAIFCSFYVVSG